MKFKKGDKVKCIWNCNGTKRYVGNTYIVKSHANDTNEGHCVYLEGGPNMREDELELIKTKPSMNLQERVRLAFKGEPDKSFAKAGITDMNDDLTPDGTQVFLSWLLRKNGNPFKKEVVDLLKKTKKEDKEDDDTE